MEPLKLSAPERAVIARPGLVQLFLPPTGEAEVADGFYVGGLHRCPVMNWCPLRSGSGAQSLWRTPTDFTALPVSRYFGLREHLQSLHRLHRALRRQGRALRPNHAADLRRPSRARDVASGLVGVMITGGHKAIGTDLQKILFGNVSGYRDTPGAPTGSPTILLGLRVFVIGRAFSAWSAK